jgi:hypothetical protein
VSTVLPPVTEWHKRRSVLIAVIGLFGGLWALYIVVGMALHLTPDRPLYARELLFEADVRRLTFDITSTSGPHIRSDTHPLFVLFANPVGSLFATILGGRTTSAAIAFNALAGALAAVATLRLFWGLSGGRLSRAVLATLVTSVAMSRLLFSSIPETYAMSALSIVITHLVFYIDLHERRLSLAVWVAAGVLALGVTVTNFAQTFLCFLLARYAREKIPVRALSGAAGFTALAVTAVALLSVVQAMLYPSIPAFAFLKTTVGEEVLFLKTDILTVPGEVLSELVRNFFVFNVVGGIPHAMPDDVPGWPPTDLARLTYGGTWAFSLLGYGALAVWAALALLPTGRRTVMPEHSVVFYVGLGLCVLFNLLLHSVYLGRTVVIELFIYTANFTFPVMLLVLGRWVTTPRGVGTWLLGVFLVLLTLNNLDVMRRIMAHYS